MRSSWTRRERYLSFVVTATPLLTAAPPAAEAADLG